MGIDLRSGKQGRVIPDHWSTFKFSAVWANTGTTAGTITLRGDYQTITGVDLKGSRTLTANATPTSPTTAHEAVVTELATDIAVPTSGDVILLSTIRTTSGTLADDIELA